MDRHYEGGLPPGECGVRLGERPMLSIVVASQREARAVDEILSPLVPECAREDVELVISLTCAARERDALAVAFPGVRFAAVPSMRSVADLRAAGMALATGDIVLIAEDHGNEGGDGIARRMLTRRARSEWAGEQGDARSRPETPENAWASYFLRRPGQSERPPGA